MVAHRAGLAVAARKEVGGSGNGRNVVHRVRGHVLAYETTAEQVFSAIYYAVHSADADEACCWRAPSATDRISVICLC